MAEFEIEDLHVAVEGREILKGVSLGLGRGEVHAVMGPNGSGKSTLSNTLMGHPGYEVTGGRVLFRGQDLLQLEPDERARLGVYLAFQYPTVVPGVTMANFLRKPEIAILDETDSGLDIDSIKFVSEAINSLRGPDLGILIITHYTRILQFIKPDFVHVLVHGQVVRSGGPEVADQLERTGYAEWGDEPAAVIEDSREVS